MPRKLKVYQTSQGFYDLAIAAPSMKAALEAWGSTNKLFHQGFAKESDDGDVIAATMAKPGVVLRRPVGSKTPFKEHAELPTAASLAAASEGNAQVKKTSSKKKAPHSKSGATDAKTELAAAAAYEKEERSANGKGRRRQKQPRPENGARPRWKKPRRLSKRRAPSTKDARQ
jgi:colicin import membrane protein